MKKKKECHTKKKRERMKERVEQSKNISKFFELRDLNNIIQKFKNSKIQKIWDIWRETESRLAHIFWIFEFLNYWIIELLDYWIILFRSLNSKNFEIFLLCSTLSFILFIFFSMSFFLFSSPLLSLTYFTLLRSLFAFLHYFRLLILLYTILFWLI